MTKSDDRWLGSKWDDIYALGTSVMTGRKSIRGILRLRINLDAKQGVDNREFCWAAYRGFTNHREFPVAPVHSAFSGHTEFSFLML